MTVTTFTAARRAAAFLACAWLCVPACAEEAELAEPPPNPVFEAANRVAQRGPAVIPIVDEARLELPAGYMFIPMPEAEAVMKEFGNSVGEEFQGLVFPLEGGDWFVTVDYSGTGHIADDDARNWDAEELLESIRQGTREGNKERARLGIPGLDIVGWAEKPAYDEASHRLVWSVAAKDQGVPADAAQTINYHAYALGRVGLVNLNLVTTSDVIDADKAHAKTLIDAVAFNEGRRYADFDANKDEVAAYGLAALIAGVAAKKLGLFALIAAFVAKFGKVLIVAGAAGASVLWKKYRNRKAPPTAEA